MLDREQELKGNKQQCLDLRKQIKDLEKMSKDKGKALERLTEGDDYNYKIRNMIDEIRMWKEKIRHRQEVYERNECTTQAQDERLATLEKDNHSLMTKIQTYDIKVELEPDKAKNTKTDAAMETINKDKTAAKEEYEYRQKLNRKEMKQAQREVKELTTKRDALYSRLKELDQEQRISTLKLRECGRILKHNQLKPLSPAKYLSSRESTKGEGRSKYTLGKRGSTSNLLTNRSSKKTLNPVQNSTRGLKKTGNTQSTQLLLKKQQYSKPKDEDSDEDFEKNQVIDYNKLQKQKVDNSGSRLGTLKDTKPAKNTFETKASLRS